MALLDNPFWNALTGLQARFASGSGRARRFSAGFSPIICFADAQQPDFSGIEAHCASGDHFYCDAWPGDPPAGWEVEAQSPVLQMVREATSPELAPLADRVVKLGTGHAAQMMALAQAANPGPFGPRTPELGEYWGIFDGARLAAMAGERLHLPGHREISAVCTLAEYRGRSFARTLVATLVNRQLERGERPFLHVMADNPAAKLYAQLGFTVRRVSGLRVLRKV